MLVQCEDCNGAGQTTPDHPNDPDARLFPCECCHGQGQVEAVPSDLDGARVRYLWLEGYVTWERANDTLTLEADDVTVVNLLPSHVQVIS